MTYCLAIKSDHGLVFASDSRTHGGVDNINIYSKMHTFAVSKERSFVLLSAGNLATTQAVINTIQRDLTFEGTKENLSTIGHMYDVAHYIGIINRKIQKEYRGDEQQSSANFGASFIIGGQIEGSPPELFLVYPEGNYIVVSEQNPFLQIGETKYGKPILDRLVTNTIALEFAAQCALVSIDSTMRSNLSVGPPLELMIYHADSFDLGEHYKFKEDDGYLMKLRESWSIGLRKAFDQLPSFDFKSPE